MLSVYRIKDDTTHQDELHLYGSSRIGMIRPERNLILAKQYGDTSGTLSLVGMWRGNVYRRGQKFFELANHLGNVLVTVSDKKIGLDNNSDSTVDYYMPNVVTANDYYPFGMGMPERRFSATGSYRYGFNGKENDNEVKGEGNQQDYGMRIYDPRLGKFLSVDPLTQDYPWYSPYQFAGNSPIQNADLDGAEEWAKNYRQWCVQQVQMSRGTVNRNIQTSYNPPSPITEFERYLPHKIEERKIEASMERFRASIHRKRIPASTATVSSYIDSEFNREMNEYYKQQYAFTQRMAEATMTPEGMGGMALAYWMHGVASIPVNAGEHAYGVYEGIRNRDYWKITKNALLFGVDISPAFFLKGASIISSAEKTIVNEANAILASSEFQVLRSAHISGVTAEINIGGRTILYEPTLNASGFTLMSENSFILGREAFKSSEELGKTLLHELYRLRNSQVMASGLTGSQATTETNAAFNFAERALPFINK